MDSDQIAQKLDRLQFEIESACAYHESDPRYWDWVPDEQTRMLQSKYEYLLTQYGIAVDAEREMA